MKHSIIYGVYVAKFPFLESTENKSRPVIVISSPTGQYEVITVIPISSKAGKESIDIQLASWSESGLIKPSIARIHRISTILKVQLDRYLGQLSEQDTKDLKIAIKQFLNI